jgi:hypothetical protein
MPTFRGKNRPFERLYQIFDSMPLWDGSHDEVRQAAHSQEVVFIEEGGWRGDLVGGAHQFGRETLFM